MGTFYLATKADEKKGMKGAYIKKTDDSKKTSQTTKKKTEQTRKQTKKEVRQVKRIEPLKVNGIDIVHNQKGLRQAQDEIRKQQLQRLNPNGTNAATETVKQAKQAMRAVEKVGEKEARNLIDFSRNAYDYAKAIKNKDDKKEAETVSNMANAFDRSLVGRGLKTAGNFATRTGHGALKGADWMLDWGIDKATSKPLQYARFAEKLLNPDKKEKIDQKYNTIQNYIDDYTKQDLADITFKELGWDEDTYRTWEKGSLVNRNNLGGQISETMGEQFLPLLLGSEISSNLVGNSIGNKFAGTKLSEATKGLTGADKYLTGIKTVGENAAKFFIKNAPSMMPFWTTSYGGALEEALNEGATREQARRYATASAAVETGTEMMFDGIPAIKGSSSTADAIANGLIDKATGKITNKFAKQVVSYLARMGYVGAGEGAEEMVSEILNPALKNATYSNGEKIDWKQVLQSGMMGFISGEVMGAQNTFEESRNAVNNQINRETFQNSMQNTVNNAAQTTFQEITSQLDQLAQQRVQQIDQAVQQGQMTAQEGNQEIEDIQRYVDAQKNTLQQEQQPQQNQNNQLAQQAVQQINQQVQNGQISPQDGIQQIEDIQNYLQAQENSQTTPVTNETTQDNINTQEEQNVAQNEITEDETGRTDGLMTNDEKALEHINKMIDMLDSTANENHPKFTEKQKQELRQNALEMTQRNREYVAKKAQKENIAKQSDAFNLKQEEKTTKPKNEISEETRRKGIARYGDSGLWSSISKEEFIRQNYLPNSEKEYGLTREQVGEMFDNSKTKEYKQLYDKMTELYRNEDVKKAIPLEERQYLVFDAYDKNKSYAEMEQDLVNAVNERVNKKQSSPKTETNEQQIKQAENKSNLKEVVDEDLYDVDMKEVENQIYREEYKLNEDVDDEDGPVGNYWDIDDTYFKLKNGNTLWLETPTEYGKLKNGKTNYNDEIHNKIEMFIEDANGNIIDEYTLNNEKGEFTREDILNGIKQLTYDDSNKQPEGQIDMFGNVHVSKKSNNNTQPSRSNIEQQPTNQVQQEQTNIEQQPTQSNVETKEEQTNIPERKNESVIRQEITGEKGKEYFMENGADEKVAQILSEKPKQQKEKLRDRISETAGEAYRLFVSSGGEAERIAKVTNRPDVKYKLDKAMRAEAEANQHIGKSQRDLNYKQYKNFTDENGNKTSMSLNGIREDAKRHNIPESALNEYLAHNLNTDRYMEDKPVFGESVTDDDSYKRIEELEKEYPEINRIAQNVWAYEHNELKNTYDSGRISKEDYDRLAKYEHYVRIQRNIERKGNNAAVLDKNGKIQINQGIQQAKGGNQDILPILETIAQRTVENTKANRLNEAAKELGSAISMGSEDSTISAIDDEESFGVNPDLFKQNDDGTYTMTFFNNGKATVVPINKAIYDAFVTNKTISAVENNKVFKAVTYAPKKMSSMFRSVVTDKNPMFMATNALKDIGDAPFNSKYTKEFAKAYASTEALRQVAGNGVYNQLYNAAGGQSDSYFTEGEFKDKSQSKIGKATEKLLTPIEKGNEIVETVPRMAEFIATIKANGYEVNKNGDLVLKDSKKAKGRTAESVLDEALYNAAEVTTNFKRGGDLAKAINRNGGTFFNASIQGFDKQIRNFKDAFTSGDKKKIVGLLLKALIFGIAPTMLNDAANDDDDEYKNMQDYLKDNYYLFKGKDGNYIRIPKGRAMSVIGSAYRRTKDYASGNKDAFKGYINFASGQVAPNNPFESNIIAPIFAVKNNKSWTGSKIVSQSMEKRPAEEQYNEKTDEFSKWLGGKLKVSPMKINYLIDQYSGGIGDVALPMMTPKATSKSNNPLVQPFVSKFTADSTYQQKSVGNFYDAMDAAETKKYSSKATKEDKVKYSYLYSQNMKLSELYKEQSTIQADNSLSKKEKYEQAREVQKKINKLADESVKNVNNIKDHKYYAIIGDNTYYLTTDEDGNDKWAKDAYADSHKKSADKKGMALYDYYKEKYEKRKAKEK